MSGLHGTALAGGALIAGVFSAALTRRFGRGVAAWTGLASLVAGALMYTGFLALAGALGGALLAGLGGSLIVNAGPGILGDRHGRLGTAALTEANALAAAIGTVSPLIVAAAVASAVGWRAAPLLVVVLAALLVVFFGRTRVPPAVVPAEHGGTGRLPVRYWILWGVLVASIAIEFCLAVWCADLLHERHGVSIERAGTGVTAVVAGIAVGRLAGARAARRYAPTTLMHVALATAALGFVVFWVTTGPVPAFVGLVISGMGVSVLYPCGISLAIDASEGRTDQATARGSFAAALAVGGGLLALGAIGDRAGVHLAFLVVPVLIAAAVGGILLEQRLARRARSSVLSERPLAPPP